MQHIDTIFGRFASECRRRLDLTYDYETSAIFSFFDVAAFLEANAIVDVGANIGVYSVFCLGVPSVTEVHAIEPAPGSFELLKRNAALQDGTSRITLHQAAASNINSQLKFNIVDPLSGVNAIAKPTDKGETIIVEARKVDELVKASGRRIAIKIDVEGHELNALDGMTSLLSSNECYVQVECLRESRLSDLRDFMAFYGFHYVFSLRDDHLFVSQSLGPLVPDILAIVADAVSNDLHDLMTLRRQKREIAIAARKLRDAAGYKHDPVNLRRGQSPF